MEYICELKNISKRFHTINNETKALEDLSLRVKKGEIVSIVGPSGSGKSTVLNLIAGLEEPSAGQIKVNTDSIGFMFQKDQLYEWRNIYKNCLLGLEVKKMATEENKNKVMNMLKNYGLYSFRNHYPSQLSGGMRQRAALVRTLAVEPDLLLLDEPFSALDYQTRLSVGNEVGQILRKEKITTVLVTHDIPEAVSISDRVIVFTERPARVKKDYEIKFDECEGGRTPMKCRNTLEFGEYFRQIWRDLDAGEN
ncbi:MULTISPECIES: ABC transporter ATP-binding protein [unclassified Sedimentibacter]|uniref:ABC transporter ATP-binding protein n=1 Tax=unclassified Sedimentibacter TaxID=2649220 RepID=UPI0027DF341E|nr:ABC transporter ATP-binding protein [Sedimentibacter sp. MB35-C1]WMJ78396.1 ABC transporter ATP-binding protein [Sedimentibacter sp. MB35-C1]